MYPRILVPIDGSAGDRQKYRAKMNHATDSRSAADPSLILALRRHLQDQLGAPVPLLETHISWVLLAGPVAYKLKKPVRLSFVDFGTLAARKHFCEEEVRLNQRLAASLYLGVASVCGPREAPTIGPGEAIDYVVCMQRFPDGALLQELLAARRLESAQLDGLAQRMAEFHGNAPSAAPLSDFGSSEQVTRAALDVVAGLREACAPLRIDAIQAWVEEHARALRTAWLARQRTGAVRECHGDLHLANVVLFNGELLPFDCIEFDPALRWIDVLSDMSFLTMDLKAHGRDDLAFRVLDVYLQHSGDYAGLTVLRFYEVYRALVRARVAGLRACAAAGGSQPGDPDYLACAQRLMRCSGGAPRLLIMHGLSGSGKSTLAGRLSEAAGAIRIRSDVERKRLFGLSALQRSAGGPVDIYTPEATRRTFGRLADCARAALQAGYAVIVDAAFLRRAERQRFRALAAQLQVPFAILHCRTGPARLRQRVAERSAGPGDASEATLDVLRRQFAFQEPLDADERAIAWEVATDDLVDVASLCARWLAPPAFLIGDKAATRGCARLCPTNRRDA